MQLLSREGQGKKPRHMYACATAVQERGRAKSLVTCMHVQLLSSQIGTGGQLIIKSAINYCGKYNLKRICLHQPRNVFFFVCDLLIVMEKNEDSALHEWSHGGATKKLKSCAWFVEWFMVGLPRS